MGVGANVVEGVIDYVWLSRALSSLEEAGFQSFRAKQLENAIGGGFLASVPQIRDYNPCSLGAWDVVCGVVCMRFGELSVGFLKL